ncbi:hypothetical protein [Kutzneria sp. 744]|uniref:hypothetical protein n=1 Tax=Kutzneria sp. (strain 744) TaxID=345341 RepID=UPI0003EEB04F|nr:hypothetical protein [Kutzneria sp. 744]EWM13761.1 hypothetical protein KUTG_04065 [Kutzneria sp. 744]
MNEDEIARAVAHVRRWIAAHPDWRRWSAEDIAAALAQDDDWATVTLAGWMRIPDGALIAMIVEKALPYPTNIGVEVLVEAIQIAARKRTRTQRIGALTIGAAAAALVWTLFNS